MTDDEFEAEAYRRGYTPVKNSELLWTRSIADLRRIIAENLDPDRPLSMWWSLALALKEVFPPGTDKQALAKAKHRHYNP